MAFDAELVERLREVLTGQPGLDEKKMFGGVCYLLNGNLLVGVWKDSLVVRLDPADVAVLSEPHVGPFDITGRPMKGWILVEPEGAGTTDDVQAWVQRARRYVETLPAKTEGSKPKMGSKRKDSAR